MPGMHLYSVLGRKNPNDLDQNPKLYRLKIFAPNKVVAKSRFWYFMRQLRKMKRATGQILAVNEISDRAPTQVRNFAIWVRYNSRSGTHNALKEYRATSQNEAVQLMYLDFAARHRARFSSIHIIRVAEVAAKDCSRPIVTQYHDSNIKFPLPNRFARMRALSKENRSTFVATRPSAAV